MGIRKYGTSTDDQVSKESAEAREIVKEIIDHGVSQNVIIYIINDLALNLENPEHMRRIVNTVRAVKDDNIAVVNKSPLEV